MQIYPEGVLRFYYPGIRRFKNGAFAYAYDNNVPLLPSVITYAQPTGLHRLFKRKPCLRLTVLPPVYPDVSRPKRDEIARLRAVCTRQMTDFYRRNSLDPRHFPPTDIKVWRIRWIGEREDKNGCGGIRSCLLDPSSLPGSPLYAALKIKMSG